MLSLRKPSEDEIRRFVERQQRLDFSYPEVGATSQSPPPGYSTHRIQSQLGVGESDFLAAKGGVERWKPFETGWSEIYPPDTPIEIGRTVAVLVRVLGVWSLNACRIVYVIDEPRRYGFAYGTLPEHAESGEERFEVQWRDDDSVWYKVDAFFRPNQFLARLAWPYLSWAVNQFRRDSAKAMKRP